jgi:phosphoglycolate phosphatase
MHDTGRGRQGARRLIAFDFDGTLADTWRDLATALNETLAEAGLEGVTGPEVKAWIGGGALKLLQRALPPQELEPERLSVHMERFARSYDRCCLDTTDLYPGVRECLDALEGEYLAVLSNKPLRFLDRVVEGLGLDKRFCAVLGGDSMPVQKPDPAVLEHLVRRLDEPPREVWMVGDSAVDVRTGRAAGARTIGCTWGMRGVEELIAAGADILVDHASEIAPRVLGRG